MTSPYGWWYPECQRGGSMPGPTAGLGSILTGALLRQRFPARAATPEDVLKNVYARADPNNMAGSAFHMLERARALGTDDADMIRAQIGLPFTRESFFPPELIRAHRYAEGSATGAEYGPSQEGQGLTSRLGRAASAIPIAAGVGLWEMAKTLPWLKDATIDVLPAPAQQALRDFRSTSQTSPSSLANVLYAALGAANGTPRW